jgi:hypothetical protein
MYGAQSVDCGSILAFLSGALPSTLSAVAWALAENVGSWDIMLAALCKVFVPANVTPALRTLDHRDG